MPTILPDNDHRSDPEFQYVFQSLAYQNSDAAGCLDTACNNEACIAWLWDLTFKNRAFYI
jgi:hypothetical protein